MKKRIIKKITIFALLGLGVLTATTVALTSCSTSDSTKQPSCH
jgi:hypothetical protein